MVKVILRRHFIIIVIFAIFAIQNGNVAVSAKKIWTEEDEARRIQQIMEAEQMEYEMEQRSQTALKLSADDIVKDGELNYPRAESYQYVKGTTISTITVPSIITAKSDDNYWCYYCASPLNTMSGNMQRAIEKFLHIRRTAYPVQVKNIRCSEPRNLSELAVEHCRHPYCQTLILTDHDTGSAFTMRGCAETFGAINEKLLDSRNDNTCQRLHERLDIQECICRHRRYCFPGNKHHRLFGASATKAFFASAPSANIVSMLCYILLIFVKLTLDDIF